MLNTLENLIKLARERKASPVEGSYTNKLLTDKALSKAKVLEEVDELIEAIEKNTNKVHEAADVFYLYHLLWLQLIHQLPLKLLLCLNLYL